MTSSDVEERQKTLRDDVLWRSTVRLGGLAGGERDWKQDEIQPTIWLVNKMLLEPSYALVSCLVHGHLLAVTEELSSCLQDRIWSMKSKISTAKSKWLQSCPTLCDPIDGSPPGSAVPGILQARTAEWVAISFSNAWKWKVKVKSLSRVRLLATPWTAGKSTGVTSPFTEKVV